MKFIQEVLNLLERKQDKKKLDLRRDWFEFGRTRPSSLGNPQYTPKMNPYAIRYDDLKCNIISGLVEGTGTENTIPVWSTVGPTNCGVQTLIDSVYSQNAAADTATVSADLTVLGNATINGDLLVLGTQTIIESTVVQIADNIFQINSGGAGVNAGIEVVQPSGTYQFYWDSSINLWSLGPESLRLQDISVNGFIRIDGEGISNITTEVEGLDAEDNDNSLPTTAAVKDYVDNSDLDVSADTGTALAIALTNDELQIRGDQLNIFTDANGAQKINIRLSNDITVDTINLNGDTVSQIITSSDTISGNPYDYTVPTSLAVIEYVDTKRDYVSNVVLNGESLDFTGVNNAFNGSINLSSLLQTAVNGFTVVDNQPYSLVETQAGLSVPISFTNTEATPKHYHISVTTQNNYVSPYATDDFVDLSMIIKKNAGGGPLTIMEWEDTRYTRHTTNFSKSYVYTAMNINPNEQLSLWIVGTSGLILSNLTISIIPFDEDAVVVNKISIP